MNIAFNLLNDYYLPWTRDFKVSSLSMLPNCNRHFYLLLKGCGQGHTGGADNWSPSCYTMQHSSLCMTLSCDFCGLVLLRIQHIFSHRKLTLYPHQIVTHTKGGHALVLRSLRSFTSSATGIFTHFVNVWISNNWPVIVWIIRIEWLMGATGSHIILWNPAYCTNLFLHFYFFWKLPLWVHLCYVQWASLIFSPLLLRND